MSVHAVRSGPTARLERGPPEAENRFQALEALRDGVGIEQVLLLLDGERERVRQCVHEGGVVDVGEELWIERFGPVGYWPIWASLKPMHPTMKSAG